MPWNCVECRTCMTCSIDHLCQIGALIASAQGMRSSEGGRQDTWEVNETELKLIRHVKVWRNEMLDPRIKLANRMPVPVLRLTGERLTHKVYRDGSTVTVRDANFLTMTNTRPRDEKDWRGRVEFGLTHKPQRRHVRKRCATSSRSNGWQTATIGEC